MGRFRDAITGLFTTKRKAEASPDTTVEERFRHKPGRLVEADELARFDTIATGLASSGARRLRNKALAHDLRVFDSIVDEREVGHALKLRVTLEVVK